MRQPPTVGQEPGRPSMRPTGVLCVDDGAAPSWMRPSWLALVPSCPVIAGGPPFRVVRRA